MRPVMNCLRTLRLPLFSAVAMMLASCVSDSSPTPSLAAQTEAAEEAFDNGSVNKGELLKILLETDIIRGRRAYEKSRLTMTRSHNMELLLDPPRYHRHQSMLEKARENKTVSEEEYLLLRNLVKVANEEWLARRSRITQDRARWGFPR